MLAETIREGYCGLPRLDEKEAGQMDELEQVYDRLDKMHTALSAGGSGEAYDIGLMDGIAVARQYVRRAMIDRAKVTEAEAEAVWPGITAEVADRHAGRGFVKAHTLGAEAEAE